MKQPNLMQKNRVKVAEILVGERLRPVSDAAVESLIASITEVGVMKDAIHLRKKRDGLFLLAGAHRLEAARRLGWEEIEAKVWTDVTDDWARLIEIDDNLAGAEMNALDTAVFLAARKEVYERLHPETRAIAFKGNQHTGKLASDIVSFATSTAEKFGISKRHVERLIAAGSRISTREVEALRGAHQPITLKDLTELAKIGEPDDRVQVVLKLAGGNARSASEARRQLRVEQGIEGPAKDPIDLAYLKLLSDWDRAPMAAKKRFLLERAKEIWSAQNSGAPLADWKGAAK